MSYAKSILDIIKETDHLLLTSIEYRYHVLSCGFSDFASRPVTNFAFYYGLKFSIFALENHLPLDTEQLLLNLWIHMIQ